MQGRLFAENGMPLGSVEPHQLLLKQPAAEQKIYKVMSFENFIKSSSGNYLHFQRVDTFKDFTNADTCDGQQLPLDQIGNQDIHFAKDPAYTAATYYDYSRSRTYACCFSLENSDYICREYGNEDESLGKVCLVFEFGKLRKFLNQTFGQSSLICGDLQCHQIFSINYGIVEYVKREEHRQNQERLPNPIQYTYLKDEEKYGREKELRISLSAMGIGKFVLDSGAPFNFASTMQVRFDFRSALANDVIEQILTINPEIKSKLEALDWSIQTS